MLEELGATDLTIVTVFNKADLADVVTKRMAQRMVPESILVSARTGAGLQELAAADPDRRFSPFCWRIRMALAHKGLDVNTVAWHFADKDALADSQDVRGYARRRFQRLVVPFAIPLMIGPGAISAVILLSGNLPGFVYSHDFFPQPGDLFWSPADWAWAGGLYDALLPTWAYGLPILGTRGKFDPERAFRLLERYGVRNTFLFPTALKMMMKAVPEPRRRYKVNLRTLMSGGESVGDTVFQWTREALGVTDRKSVV